MTAQSNILIISNNVNEINEIHAKLNLLRDINQIISSNTVQAMDFCRKFVPDLIIAFVEKNIDEVLITCENIKTENILKTTPIILIFEEFNEDFALSAFDIGINDYLTKPFNKSELLMRVIWSLQKHEIIQKLEKKQRLLSELGVVNVATGAYTPEHISRVFTNEIDSAIKYKYPITILAVEIDKNSPVFLADDFFAEIIRRSIRTADVIGKISEGKFLILLNKTDATSLEPVFDRISKNLGEKTRASVGASESFPNMTFESMSINALKALEEAQQKGGAAFCEFQKGYCVQPQESLKTQIKQADSAPNFKLFKQIFIKKTEDVVSPVFETFKEENEDYTISYEIASDVSILEVQNNFSSAKLVITNPEFSQVELKFINPDQSEEVQTFDLQNFDEETLKTALVQLLGELN